MEFGQRPKPGRRLAGIGFVVLFHAALIYALVSGLARKAIEVLPAPIETKILQEIKSQEAPPPPPPPTFEPPPPTFVPPPEIVIQQPPPPPAAVTTVVPKNPPAAVPKNPSQVAPVINARRSCREPEYPSSSQRLGEKGTVTLAFLIGIDGKVAESRVEGTSGFPRLDEAARTALSRCKFVPGTVNGVATPAWAKIKYVWKIPGSN
ncbi:MAG: TonB family protein [Pseudomonadota bacterium]